MRKPKIIIVGADKGGVGKTTVTRILADYMTRKNVSARYYDTEFPGGDLKRFIKSAEVLDISKVTSQMEIFDVLDPESIIIIDLRAALLTDILEELKNAKLLEEVQNGNMSLVLLHILGPTINSLKEVISVGRQIGGGTRHLFVKNYINDSTFFEWDKDADATTLREMMAGSTITVPELTPMAVEKIQKEGCTFIGFADDKNQSRILRGHVSSWVNKVFTEFDRVDIARREDA